jgi:recombination protein RecT
MVTNKNGTQVLEKLNGTSKPETLMEWVQKMRPQLEKALPKHISPDRILRIVMTTLRTNPKLGSCDKMSFIAAVMQSAQLGLEPNTPLGEAYIIPYNSKKGPMAQFQIGYKGIITLCQNTGQYRSIYSHEVYKNDKFFYQLGLHKDLVHVPADEPEGEPIYFYAVYHLLNGGYDFAVWSKKKVENHRDKYSKSADYDSSSWKTSPIPMSLKTVLKAALNYAPKSIELTRQLSMDETVKKEIATDMSEVPAEEFDITPLKEEPETTSTAINKQTGEVTDDITEKEKEEIERAVDKKTAEKFISK